MAQIALAAMDSESWRLPLDYLQGHKDGLEWASQLAEANHPETGDWIYDDPIELAKAIRKGPDMPLAQPVADSEPVIVVGDDGGDALSYRRLIQSFEPGTKLYRHAQPEPVVSAELLHTAASAIEDLLTTKDRTGAYVWFDLPFRLRSAANAQSPGSEPATVPGKWIPVSERMPDNAEPVLCIEKRADFGTYGQPFVCWHDGGGWVGKTNYRPIVTHWMPLPAALREVE
ncbi:TPA: DUF551 domain-containing protein [Klebsiella pneumoniae]|nr:DUF551 domain-containing protein [Klebsiella pneumoniae]HCM6324968.1 DUF551 domain-containing protein [Klebsiella pneumoniae]HDU4765080.1 DUF551 domain-containing protein [Klebsiella pneumoniae subsp. pneumoniae]